MNEIKALNTWIDIPYSFIGRLNICKISVLPNLIYRFSAVFNKNPSKLSCGSLRTDSTIYIESHKTQNSPRIIGEQSWKTDTMQLQD